MHVCESCGYAYEDQCGNPVCETVNPQAAAHWKAEAEKREAERAERERIQRIRDRAWGYRG